MGVKRTGPKGNKVNGKVDTIALWGALLSILLNKHNFIDQIKKNEMDRAYGRYGGKEKGMQGLVGNPEGTTWKT